MSVTAKQLSQSGARGKDIDNIVKDQLQVIDDRLQRANRTWGRNVVTVDLPQTFGLPGLDKKDAQRIIYSAIIRSLEKRGFEIRILLETPRTTIYIAWMTDLDAEEVAAMNALIRLKRIEAAELGAFFERGTVPAPHAASAARAGRADPPPEFTVTGADQVMAPRGGVAPVASTRVRTDPAPASSAETAILNGA